MIGKRDKFWGGFWKQTALKLRWRRAADCSRGGIRQPEMHDHQQWTAAYVGSLAARITTIGVAVLRAQIILRCKGGLTFHERLLAVVDRKAVQLLYLSGVRFALAVTAHRECVLWNLWNTQKLMTSHAAELQNFTRHQFMSAERNSVTLAPNGFCAVGTT